MMNENGHACLPRIAPQNFLKHHQKKSSFFYAF